MSFIGKIIDRFPSSKRSVRALREDIANLKDEVHKNRSEIDYLVDVVKKELRSSAITEDGVQLHLDQLQSTLNTQTTQIKLLAWEALRNPGEDPLDSRKRVFENIPPATGSLRLLQKSCAQLIHEFDMLCSKNSIIYWADFGTLLGAVRHKNFIPWDDDTDLGMPREEIQKLKDLIETNPEYQHRYSLSVVYDPFALSRQIRFMYNDPNNPAFLDLFIYDFTQKTGANAYSERSIIREELILELKSLSCYQQWCEIGYLHDGDKYSDLIRSVFERYDSKMYEQNEISFDQKAAGVIFAYDNCTLDTIARIYPTSEILPTQTLTFEDFPIQVPRNTDLVLGTDYGDIYQLPDDIVSHFDHVSRELFNDAKTVDALKRSSTNPEEYLPNIAN